MAEALVKVLRSGDGAGERYDEFAVPVNEQTTVQGALRYIYEQLDPTLAFRDYNCYLGVCTCCMVRVDGRQVRSCTSRLEPDTEIVVEPPRGKVIRDLVSDFSADDNS